MTELYLIRHVQAEGNLYRAMQGHWNGAPTALGLRQRDLLAERFRDISVDELWSSDLTRAQMTASALQKYRPLRLHTDPMLREINVGPWEGQFFGNLRHDKREELEAFARHPSRWQLDGAETYADVMDRVTAAVRAICERCEGKTVAIVSHGVSIRCFLARELGLDIDDRTALPLGDNTAVSHLFYENGVFTADYLNDCAHLAPLGHKDGVRPPELRDEPLDFVKDAAYYTQCYADAWIAAHGSLEGFSADSYLCSAREHQRVESRAVLKIFREEEPFGLLNLDPRRCTLAGYRWLSLLYLRSHARGQGLGIQLLGRAILYYKTHGRRAIRLHVAEDNRSAVSFYRRWGFHVLGSERNELGNLLLMEKRLEADHA